MDYSQYTLEKTGYLKEEFRLFHINDRTDREFSYHYHDFHKIIVFLPEKSPITLREKPTISNHGISFWSVRARSTNRKLIRPFHMSVTFSGSATTFPCRN